MSFIFSALSYLNVKKPSTPRGATKTAVKKTKSGSSRVEKNVARSPTSRATTARQRSLEFATARKRSLESAAAKIWPWDPKPDVKEVLAILDSILSKLEIHEIRTARTFISKWAMRTLSGNFSSSSSKPTSRKATSQWDAKDEVDQVIAILDRILSYGEVSEIRVAKRYLSKWAMRTCYAIYNVDNV